VNSSETTQHHLQEVVKLAHWLMFQYLTGTILFSLQQL